MKPDSRPYDRDAAQMELFALMAERTKLRLLAKQIDEKRGQVAAAIVKAREQARKPQAGQTKTCRKCRIEMVADCFYTDSRYQDGLYPYCRVCKSDMTLARYHAA